MKAILSLFILAGPSVAALSAVSPDQVPSASSPKKTKKLNFHQVLQRVGKTVFRPGGSAATIVMHEWADLGPGDTALEMSAGLGTGGMALALKRQCNVILTDQDEDRLAKASEMASKKGLDDLITTRRLDMRKIRESLGDDERFSAVIVEASLSHQPDVMKEKILQDLQHHTDQLLFHEISLRDVTEEQAKDVRRKVGSALAIGFYPLTLDAWRDLLERNGYKVTHMETGPIQVLNPKNLLQDEGPAGVAKIAWNLATHPDLRERVRSTKKMVDSNKESLGYVILRAVKR